MIKVYYCKKCDITFYLSTEIDTECKSCGDKCLKIRRTYPEFTSLNADERTELIHNEIKKDEKRNMRRERMHENILKNQY